MERLTKRAEDKRSAMIWFVDKEKWDLRYEPCEMDSHQIREVLCKLAAYEDAEEQGLLFSLPCKIGDTVWGLVNYCNDCELYDNFCHRGCKKPRYRLKEFKINHFEIHNNGLRVSALSHYDGEGKWGETVFFTREDAENALKAMQEDKQ